MTTAVGWRLPRLFAPLVRGGQIASQLRANLPRTSLAPRPACVSAQGRAFHLTRTLKQQLADPFEEDNEVEPTVGEIKKDLENMGNGPALVSPSDPGYDPYDDDVRELAEKILALNPFKSAMLLKFLMEQSNVTEDDLYNHFGGVGGGEAAPEAEEQTEFTVKLEAVPAASKIKVIKSVREITKLGLKEAKELVEKAPSEVKAGISKEEAEELAAKLKETGAEVSVS